MDDDPEFVEAVRGADTAAWRSFVEQHFGALHRWAHQRVGRLDWKIADEVVKRTCMKVLTDGLPKPRRDQLSPYRSTDESLAILTREGCPFCAKARRMLDEAGYEYAEVPLPHTVRSKVLGAIAKAGTVPQVFVNGELIGDSDRLERWLARPSRP